MLRKLVQALHKRDDKRDVKKQSAKKPSTNMERTVSVRRFHPFIPSSSSQKSPTWLVAEHSEVKRRDEIGIIGQRQGRRIPKENLSDHYIQVFRGESHTVVIDADGQYFGLLNDMNSTEWAEFIALYPNYADKAEIRLVLNDKDQREFIQSLNSELDGKGKSTDPLDPSVGRQILNQLMAQSDSASAKVKLENSAWKSFEKNFPTTAEAYKDKIKKRLILGVGSQGIVRPAVRIIEEPENNFRLGEIVAVKKTTPESKNPEEAKAELMSAEAEYQLHQHIIKNEALFKLLKKYFIPIYSEEQTTNRKNKETKYVFTDIAAGGNGLEYAKELKNKVLRGELSAEEEKKIIIKLIYLLVEAMAALHATNIVHRDLKGENLLFTEEGDLKIADFGSAEYYKDGKWISVKDSSDTRYNPPEAFFTFKLKSTARDVWSMGLTALELCNVNMKEYLHFTRHDMRSLIEPFFDLNRVDSTVEQFDIFLKNNSDPQEQEIRSFNESLEEADLLTIEKVASYFDIGLTEEESKKLPFVDQVLILMTRVKQQYDAKRKEKLEQLNADFKENVNKVDENGKTATQKFQEQINKLMANPNVPAEVRPLLGEFFAFERRKDVRDIEAFFAPEQMKQRLFNSTEEIDIEKSASWTKGLSLLQKHLSIDGYLESIVKLNTEIKQLSAKSFAEQIAKATKLNAQQLNAQLVELKNQEANLQKQETSSSEISEIAKIRKSLKQNKQEQTDIQKQLGTISQLEQQQTEWNDQAEVLENNYVVTIKNKINKLLESATKKFTDDEMKVISGLLKFDPTERMSVKEAEEKLANLSKPKSLVQPEQEAIAEIKEQKDGQPTENKPVESQLDEQENDVLSQLTNLSSPPKNDELETMHALSNLNVPKHDIEDSSVGISAEKSLFTKEALEEQARMLNDLIGVDNTIEKEELSAQGQQPLKKQEIKIEKPKEIGELKEVEEIKSVDKEIKISESEKNKESLFDEEALEEQEKLLEDISKDFVGMDNAKEEKKEIKVEEPKEKIEESKAVEKKPGLLGRIGTVLSRTFKKEQEENIVPPKKPEEVSETKPLQQTVVDPARKATQPVSKPVSNVEESRKEFDDHESEKTESSDYKQVSFSKEEKQKIYAKIGNREKIERMIGDLNKPVENQQEVKDDKADNYGVLPQLNSEFLKQNEPLSTNPVISTIPHDYEALPILNNEKDLKKSEEQPNVIYDVLPDPNSKQENPDPNSQREKILKEEKKDDYSDLPTFSAKQETEQDNLMTKYNQIKLTDSLFEKEEVVLERGSLDDIFGKTTIIKEGKEEVREPKIVAPDVIAPENQLVNESKIEPVDHPLSFIDGSVEQEKPETEKPGAKNYAQIPKNEKSEAKEDDASIPKNTAPGGSGKKPEAKNYAASIPKNNISGDSIEQEKPGANYASIPKKTSNYDFIPDFLRSRLLDNTSRQTPVISRRPVELNEIKDFVAPGEEGDNAVPAQPKPAVPAQPKPAVPAQPKPAVPAQPMPLVQVPKEEIQKENDLQVEAKESGSVEKKNIVQRIAGILPRPSIPSFSLSSFMQKSGAESVEERPRLSPEEQEQRAKRQSEERKHQNFNARLSQDLERRKSALNPVVPPAPQKKELSSDDEIWSFMKEQTAKDLEKLKTWEQQLELLRQNLTLPNRPAKSSLPDYTVSYFKSDHVLFRTSEQSKQAVSSNVSVQQPVNPSSSPHRT